MMAKVKWFSDAKEYGFLVDESGIDSFLGVRVVVGAILPQNGDSVTYKSHNAKKACSYGNRYHWSPRKTTKFK